MRPDQQIAAIAATQHGAFTDRQALEVGFTRGAIRHRRASGLWVTVHRLTYVLAGAPRTWEQAVMAGVLSFPGAVASHLTAAALWALVEARAALVDVTVRHGWPPARRCVKTHQARTLGRGDVGRALQIPVTSIARTLVDIAGALTPPRLEAAVDTALISRRIAIPQTIAYIDERRLGHLRGVGDLRRVLLDRKDGVPESDLERDFERFVIRPYNLPRPTRQRRTDGRKIDYAYPDLRIMIELDSSTWHSSAAALRDDCRRQNALTLAGWFPLHYTKDDLRNRHKAVADEMWAAIAQRSR